MSWSSSKGRIRGKIASGGFNRPDNTLAEAIDTGAGIMAQGIIKKAEEDRLEKKREKAAAAAEARRLAAQQRKKEEEERKIERQVKAIAARKGIDDKNIEAYTYIRGQVEAFGPSAAALIEKDFDDGKLSLPMVDDMREVQGPDVASDFKVQVDGIDDPVAVDDLEAISTEMLLPQQTRDAARLQMDMVAPVSEIPAESVGQTQGFAVEPATPKFDEVDFSQIQSTSDVDATLRNIEVNGINVSPAAISELKTLRSELYAQESSAWLAEASTSADNAYAAMQEFQAKGDNTNYVIAKGIYTGWLNKEKPYEGLLEAEGLIGKSAQDLRDTRAVATSLGAEEGDFSILDDLLASTEVIEADAEAKKYITSSTSYDKTISQIEAALASGDYDEDSDLITHLNNIAGKQRKQEIEANVGSQGAVAVDGLYKDPVTGEDRFAVIVRYPDGTSTLRDGTEVDYMPLTDTEAEAVGKLSVQTNKYAQELTTAATAITEGLRLSETIIGIAKDDERVRNAGGDLAQFVSGVARGTDSVIGVLGDMFKDKGDDFVITEDDVRRELKARGISENTLTAALSDEVLSLADKTAQFEAGILALVFRSGRMEGQSGNAMSNKDFERLMQMLDVKGGIVAFENTVRDYMGGKILSYDDKAMGQDVTGAIGSFKKKYGWSPVEEAMSFEEFVTKRGEATLTNAYTNTVNYSPQAATPKPSTPVTTATVNDINAFLESDAPLMFGSTELRLSDVLDRLKSFEETLEGEALATAKTTLIGELAEAMGIAEPNLRKLIETKVSR